MLRAAVVVSTLALLSPAAWSAAPAADAQARAVRERTQKLVEQASAGADSALVWLRDRGTPATATADGWRTRAEAALKDAINGALALPAVPTGVRLLAPGQEHRGMPGDPLRWTPLPDASGALPDQVVLLIHGLDEPGDVWDDLAPILQSAGHNVARFDYANDQPCATSATELLSALRDLRSRGVKRANIVGHSMGGLISRDALTRGREQGEIPVVPRLIMSGPPNQGSALARVRALAEAREQLARWIDTEGHDARLLLGFLKDGAGEAGDDLLPGSAYLTGLNARPLPAGTSITIITGIVGAGVEQDLIDLLGSAWVRKVLSAEQVAAAEAAIKELSVAIGDGIVTADSTRLAGVEDIVEIKANHRTMLRRPPLESALREAVGELPRTGSAVPVILRRLGPG
ncbi:MAG: esterase/lipase family protein [Phycisphaerales bacterium]